MNTQTRQQTIGLMMASGNFFEQDFPREAFRQLLWEEAEAETENWERKASLQDLATVWTDAEIYEWRCRMED